MNSVTLVGRLTKDPELKFGKGTGTAVCTFTVAVNRKFKREGQPEADFLPVVVFGKIGEAVANYMSKGKLVSISGSIQTRTYDAKDGSKRYVTEIIADEVNFLEKADKSGKTAGKGTDYKAPSGNSGDFGSNSDITPIDDGDIPF